MDNIISPSEAFKGAQDTVTAVVPKAFRLRLRDNRLVQFQPGVEEVPKDVMEHWYLKANGVLSAAAVKEAEAAKAAATPEPPKPKADKK